MNVTQAFDYLMAESRPIIIYDTVIDARAIPYVMAYVYLAWELIGEVSL